MEENGPFAPALVRALPGLRDVDLFVFYSYRYYQTFFGLPPVADRAVLVPTAEEDPAIELPVFHALLRQPRGILYLTPEERSLVHTASGNARRAVGGDRQRGERPSRPRRGRRRARGSASTAPSSCTRAASTATRAPTACSRTTSACARSGRTSRPSS